VYPADVQVDESLNTVRYAERSRSIANIVTRNSLRTVLLSSAESDALRAENELLQQELKELRKRVLYDVGLKGVRWADATDACSYEEQVSVLRRKLLLAEKEAKVIREGCLTEAHMADKWRDCCEFTVMDKVREKVSCVSRFRVGCCPTQHLSYFTDRIVHGHG
jgi:hypothetical protein